MSSLIEMDLLKLQSLVSESHVVKTKPDVMHVCMSERRFQEPNR